MIRQVAAFSVVACLSLVAACGQNSSSQKKSATSSSPQPTADIQCGSSSGSGGTAANAGGSGASSLNLVGTPTYSDTIQAILKTNCISCHAAGGPSPDLSTFALASAAGKASADAIASAKMPPSGAKPLTAADKTNFAAWAAGGMPQGTGAAAANTAGTAASTAPTTPAAAPSPTPSENICSAPHPAPTPVAPAPAPAPAPAAPAPAPAAPKTTPAAPAPAPAPAPTPTTTKYKYTYTANIAPYMKKTCTGCHSANGTFPDLSSYKAVQGAATMSLNAMKGGSMPRGGKAAAADIAMLQQWIADKDPQ